MKIFGRKTEAEETEVVRGSATQAMVDLAGENWRFQQALLRALNQMDPFDAERVQNQYLWYQRKVLAVLAEAGLRTVDLTGQIYDVGMAVTPLNLEDFPENPEAVYQVAQMVEPIVMENGEVRKPGTVMLSESEIT